ncbi:hypothetical protein DFJ74DRAFT_658180 [Hyaloraphidium curvatum]|nr:hypothetical protein DFJ74DRAFT_658180 [Hyaloraphidium curvatum]
MPDWTGAILWDLPAPGAGVPAARPLLAFGSSFKLPSGSSNPFNVSNDKYYEVHEKSKNIRRLAFTHAVLQHSMPALKLQHPFYRTALTVDSLRHFHRPMLRRPAEDIVLAPLRPPKKRKGEAGFGAPKNLRDLSLRDTEPFLLLEYSEEHPPMLSNIGMGALIQNYYRRRDPRDTHVPELADGEPQVVEPETRASSLEEGSLPFFLANVEPGSTVQGFSTNMFRAPIFQHAPKSSDFLVVRHPAKEGGVNYFARPIDTVYVAGQEMPRMEVPKPSSRRVTNMLKARMMVDAYRMIKASENRGELDLSKLYKEYPEFPPLHIRQKLKELAQFQRKSSHTTMWRLAPGAQLQSEAWIQKQVSPEDVCTIQSMLSAAQRLIDGGRQISDVMGDDAGEDVDVMRDMEEDLAPWNTTKNFLMAVQGKNMIKVYGDGEPTGRGEALNMLKFPKEGTFLREEDARRGKQGEPFRSSLLEQKNAFRHEIQRVFNLQNRALNNKEELPDEFVSRARFQRARTNGCHQQCGQR